MIQGGACRGKSGSLRKEGGNSHAARRSGRAEKARYSEREDPIDIWLDGIGHVRGATYRNLLLSGLQQLVLDPLSQDKIALALPANPENDPKVAAAPATIAIRAPR